MGNISNIWFLKDGGKDWCSTKCSLDDPYILPHHNGDERYLQALIPYAGAINEIWIVHNGERVYDIMEDGAWKVVTINDALSLVTFKIPTLGEGDCPSLPMGEPYEVCAISLQAVLDYIAFIAPGDPTAQNIYDQWITGDPDYAISILSGGIHYYLGGYPPTFTPYGDAEDYTWYVPCYEGEEYADFSFAFWHNGSIQGESGAIPTTVLYTQEIQDSVTLNCFHFEIPLFDGETEVNTIQSEPFECGGCYPTVWIESDYCTANSPTKTDVYGNTWFSFTGLGESQEGDLTEYKNGLRIQAVVKDLPPQMSFSANARCNVFSSSVVDRYKIQGAFEVDYPPYMAKLLTSVFAGKKLYIDGAQYIPSADSLFNERQIPGFSMFNLDIELRKCEAKIVFDCSCEPEPVNCEEDPVTGFVAILTLTSLNTLANNNMYGVDRSYITCSVVGLAGVAPVNIDDWEFYYGEPNDDFQTYDQHADSNIFRRHQDFDLGDNACLVHVTDGRGCQYTLGNTAIRDDLSCIEQAGTFDIVFVTDTSIQVKDIVPSIPGLDVDYSFTYNGVDWTSSGVTSGPGSVFNITGLTPDTEYDLYIRVTCEGGAEGVMGKYVFKTLP